MHLNGDALRYASEELRADHEIVLAAVHLNGNALRYASEELRADLQIVLAAVHQHGDASGSASAGSVPTTRSFWRPYSRMDVH